jgi:hypothetical protein
VQRRALCKCTTSGVDSRARLSHAAAKDTNIIAAEACTDLETFVVIICDALEDIGYNRVAACTDLQSLSFCSSSWPILHFVVANVAITTAAARGRCRTRAATCRAHLFERSNESITLNINALKAGQTQAAVVRKRHC